MADKKRFIKDPRADILAGRGSDEIPRMSDDMNPEVIRKGNRIYQNGEDLRRDGYAGLNDFEEDYDFNSTGSRRPYKDLGASTGGSPYELQEGSEYDEEEEDPRNKARMYELMSKMRGGK